MLFDTANGVIAHAIALARVDGITPEEVEAEIVPFLTEIVILLNDLGAL